MSLARIERRRSGARGGAPGPLTFLLALACAAVLAACGGGSDESAASLDGTGFPNVDPTNSRDARGAIDTTNLKELEVAWSAPIPGQGSFGSYASSPVLAKGVVYSQDLASNVQAIDQESGEALWTKSYEEGNLGPNGVVVAGGMVYGATASAAFALDQESGKELWSVELTRNKDEGVDMAPGYRDGVVYVSTVPTNPTAQYPAGGVGVLWALHGKTGKNLWKFETVPKGLWGKPDVNSGGGLWYPPAFDEDGFMYFGVGNPAPFPGTEDFPLGSSRPGPNLYTNSIVKMNARTGKMAWHFQLTPHDIYDWDLQGPPMLVEAGGRELVIAAGKSGIVIALDPESGELVWERPVGKHNGHDEDGAIAMRGEMEKLKPPYTVYPGVLGGVIAPMSTDGETIFAPVVNVPMTVTSGFEQSEGGGGESGGEIVAIDAATGKVKWQHEFPGAPAYGSTTVVNDVVFVTTFDGKVSAFDTGSGRLAWQVQLPTGTNTGVAVQGDTLIAPAGLPSEEGQTPQLLAYRLGG